MDVKRLSKPKQKLNVCIENKQSDNSNNVSNISNVMMTKAQTYDMALNAKVQYKAMKQNDIFQSNSGATSHMSNNSNMFVTINKNVSETLYIANGQTLQIKGIGETGINTITPDGKIKIKFTNILYVPDLNGNLISVKSYRKRWQSNTQTKLMLY